MILKAWLSLLAVVCCYTRVESNNKTKIYFGAVVPDMDYDKWTFRSAIEVAVDLINKDAKILKDHELVVNFEESNVSMLFSALI